MDRTSRSRSLFLGCICARVAALLGPLITAIVRGMQQSIKARSRGLKGQSSSTAASLRVQPRPVVSRARPTQLCGASRLLAQQVVCSASPSDSRNAGTRDVSTNAVAGAAPMVRNSSII